MPKMLLTCSLRHLLYLVGMLHFISSPDYHNACRLLGKQVTDYQRSLTHSQGRTPAFMQTGFITHPETLGSTVSQSLRSLELRHLDLPKIKEALRGNLRGDPWLNQLRRLLEVLESLERLASGEDG